MIGTVPYEEIVVLQSPAKVEVTEAIDGEILLLVERYHAAEIRWVGNSETVKNNVDSFLNSTLNPKKYDFVTNCCQMQVNSATNSSCGGCL